jgi:hypothetical protein
VKSENRTVEGCMMAHVGKAAKRAARIVRMFSARSRRSLAGGQIADRRGFAVGSQPFRRYCGGRRVPRPGAVRNGALPGGMARGALNRWGLQ